MVVSSFGKLFTMSVDGQIYAQPLYVPLVSIPQQGVHDVVYVATQNNSVYAFDADVQGGALWHVNLGPAMPTSTCCASGNLDIVPQIGITSTPVINLLSGILYVVTETLESGATVFRLHALDITTGNDKITPVVIQGSVPGSSVDSANGVLTFNPAEQRQRLGLLLLNGNVYVGFGSHEVLTLGTGGYSVTAERHYNEPVSFASRLTEPATVFGRVALPRPPTQTAISTSRPATGRSMSISEEKIMATASLNLGPETG